MIFRFNTPKELKCPNGKFYGQKINQCNLASGQIFYNLLIILLEHNKRQSNQINKTKILLKVRLFFDRSCAIINSFKIVLIFNNTSADFVLISAEKNDHNLERS
jgi:hypothetical protein